MKELSAHTEYRHLTLNYNSLRCAIMAWLHSTDRRLEAGEKAVALLELVDEILYSGRLEAHHALHCYNSVIVTVARSLDSDKAPKAYNILKRMEQQSLKPRSRDYRAVLSACSQTASTENVSGLQKQEAFRLANLTFLEYLESGLQADVDVYKEMIGLHTTLMIGDDKEENREKLVSAIFSNAPPTIQQSESIQSSLRAALSREVYDSLLKKLQ
jgi:hypothetical protein